MRSSALVKLNLPNLEAPYFVEYVLDESDSFTVSASLGALLRKPRQFRAPEVHVRVGDYKFDNTNFAGGGGGGSRYDLGSFPLDDDYAGAAPLPLAGTDSAYKSAVEAISRKRAALRNVIQRRPSTISRMPTGPFWSAVSHTCHRRRRRGPTQVRSLSAVFAKYPGVKTSVWNWTPTTADITW